MTIPPPPTTEGDEVSNTTALDVEEIMVAVCDCKWRSNRYAKGCDEFQRCSASLPTLARVCLTCGHDKDCGHRNQEQPND